MKTRIIALAVTAACASAAVAQSQYEALQFMGNELNGTARFVGMGGAMSSLELICQRCQRTLRESECIAVMMWQ